MIYSKEYQYVYLNTPKTASTSLADVLQTQFDGHCYYDRHDTRLPDWSQKYFIFATVRNPYVRAVSAYRNLISIRLNECWDKFHMMSMSQYLDYEILARRKIPPRSCIAGRIGVYRPLELNAILHAENLQEEFNILPFVTSSVDIPKLNVTPHVLLDENTIAVLCQYVAAHYQSDFTRFGYDITDTSVVYNDLIINDPKLK